MTQVLSVSANTAAYALEAVKPSQRVPRKTEIEDAIHELARKAERGEDFQLRGMMTVIKPPALTLYFLTAASQRQEPQATLEQAVEAYEENNSPQKSKNNILDQIDI
ncbi:hypothetical protein AGRO_4529 [Agrobacterium sp. ATCC 31749]|jgi:hypothetical protein|uniref:hypothetical protein n=1 Tax=Agrobacterium TaxID=357 RepID=UPI00020DBD2F|nr:MULTISPECIES: hypothetical protein [Agrobacterium]EGL62752.1 hypothetical protein AGRO_4529 [Agrobacterium sp. ATCC 31749]MDH6294951.1 hypothetical protein [Agrobacterium fabrum]QKW96689.1 hypothetical protein GSF67_06025 [Agrobacterium sp. CGMCC 11546]UXT57186.1 hypothetical protein FY134_05775 [Agrobacterium fabrum]SDB17395.1 hypothetical protein SAMN03159422_00386 [Agrobacterium fabrum]